MRSLVHVAWSAFVIVAYAGLTVAAPAVADAATLGFIGALLLPAIHYRRCRRRDA